MICKLDTVTFYQFQVFEVWDGWTVCFPLVFDFGLTGLMVTVLGYFSVSFCFGYSLAWYVL